MNLKGIYDQVKAGGFQNPLMPAMDKILERFTPNTLAELTDKAQAQALANGLPVPSDAQLSAAFTSLQNAIENTNTMVAHSNILSGIDKTTGMTITSIAKLGNAAKQIEQFNGCEFSQSVLGSIQNAGAIINDTTKVVADVEMFLENIPKWVDQIPVAVNAYSTKILNQVNSDIEAIAQAKVIVVNNSIAAGLVELTENECFSSIFASIMTKPLKDEVTKVTDEIKAIKFKSIGG